MNMKHLSDPESKTRLWTVLYSYDYMSGCEDSSKFSSITQMATPDHINASLASYSLQLTSILNIEANSIPLNPKKAGLPWHTSIDVLRQNVHFESAISMTVRLLELFATDDTAATTLGHQKKSYAEISKAEIGRINDNWSRFNAYIWPAADQGRLELIAATIVFILIFDDIWEMNDDETLQIIQAEFISRLKLNDAEKAQNATPLQAFINDIMQGFHDEDLKMGSGGMELIERLVDFINHPPPPKNFVTLGEFLDYRIHDVAASYVFACVKFSLGSNVVISSPTIAQFMALAANHLCYANDLGSFDKEKAAYINGDVLYLINTVDMVQKVFSLPDDNSAKSVTLALQLQTEKQLMAELPRLRACTDVTEEELEFVEAVVYALAGNIFTSVVMSRYGGEGTRLSTT